MHAGIRPDGGVTALPRHHAMQQVGAAPHPVTVAGVTRQREGVKVADLELGPVDDPVDAPPDSRRPHSGKWGLTCGFVGGGGRI